MSKKLYIVGNYIIKDDNGSILDYPTSSIMSERTGNFVVSDDISKTKFTITYLDAPNWFSDEAGTIPYTESTLRTFLRKNTAFKQASASGAKTYAGVIDYGDTSTDPNNLPIAGTAMEINSGVGNLSTWIDIPNDGLGLGSINTVEGVTNILDVADGKFDFSELNISDLVETRLNLSVTTNAPNATVKARLVLGGLFPLEFAQRFYSSAETDDSFVFQMRYDLSIQDLLDNKTSLQVWADKSTTIVNIGVRNYLHQ